MEIREFLKNNTVIMDGGFGTLLQAAGLPAGEHPERRNITHPDTVIEIHKAYFDAGSNIVNSNTFGANSLKFSEDELEIIISSALQNAKTAKETSLGEQEKWVALDIGPTGRLLKPFGDLDFEDAVEVFAKTVRLGVKYGAELIVIETMNDSYETKAAVLAAKENSSIPIIVTNAYSENGKLMTGASPSAMAAMLEGLGVDAIGANCSLGPKQLGGVIDELLSVSSLPVVLKPNAGLPILKNGKTVYDITDAEFADEVVSAVKKGVRIVGGCCGTTPAYIKKLSDSLSGVKPLPITEKNITFVSSYTHAVRFEEKPILIGERINPTGKKRFKQALVENDIGYILREGIAQQEKGADILDVNVGLPEIDEPEMLSRSVSELQAVIDLPLQIDTSDASALERALRLYNGKAMVNSVNGKTESMEAVFPLVKKYGGLVVALTLDENGIPETAEGRTEIAKKIIKTAESYGIGKKDLIFDTLAMTVSTDKNAAKTTLSAMRRIKEELGCHTSLGVSNISFGLPQRDIINSTFFALALENGLSAAIMNPHSVEMMKTYHAFNALNGIDEACAGYISFASSFAEASSSVSIKPSGENPSDFGSELMNSIVKGLREKASELTKKLLSEKAPLDIVESEIIPALDIVGKGYEEKKLYLPQLLMSAEAAKAAFENISAALSASGEKNSSKGTVVIATVKGDIHDIGKNIVSLLLENYGYRVIDLGKDVLPEKVLDAVVGSRAPLLGLSALMTTTVPAMEETVRLVKKEAPQCRIVVGGAVLTEETARDIGADKYAADAMDTVRYAEELFGIL